MPLSDISVPPPSSAERLSIQQLPLLTRLMYRWCASVINRALARFPTLQHQLHRLEEAETTIRRLRQERDEALGFLRERNYELERYDMAARNFFSAVNETSRELEDIRQALLTHQARVADHVQQLESYILSLQQSLQEAASDMQDAQSDLDGIELTFLEHRRQVDERIRRTSAATFDLFNTLREAELELETLERQALQYQKTTSRVYGEAVNESERLSRELDTIVAEVAQTNDLTAAHIKKLETELASLRGRQ
ncbi:MAG: hypothetical protein CFK52_08195 [Chloracidobacterium sp. CP2_5A]|nr:MAG: hypothetical protein CFK52_08195 [Chloracidobacterium sp. CP2_5A]